MSTEFVTPGSFELPVLAHHAAASGRFDAIVALGVVIRGGTPHFDNADDMFAELEEESKALREAGKQKS